MEAVKHHYWQARMRHERPWDGAKKLFRETLHFRFLQLKSLEKPHCNVRNYEKSDGGTAWTSLQKDFSPGIAPQSVDDKDRLRHNKHERSDGIDNG